MRTTPSRVTFVDRRPRSGFLDVDRALLARHFAVDVLLYPEAVTASFAFATVRHALRSEAVYCFFASEHTLLPALVFKALRRRVVLVPAGYDYADVPEHDYGLAAQGKGWLPKLLGRLADAALPISRQTLWEFLALVPSAASRTRLAYLAVDPSRWSDPGTPRKPGTVVTVANVDEQAWSRKGIDRFVAAAAADPDRCYVLAGNVVPTMAEVVAAAAPPNLEITGRLEHHDLRALLWSADVYAQLSWHETFGMAMAESMLCGCVPVIGDSMALAEVAGSWAERSGGAMDDVAAIGRAAARAGEVDRAAMARDVAGRFDLASRAEALRAAVCGDG